MGLINGNLIDSGLSDLVWIEKYQKLEQQLSQLQQDNEAMKKLIEWISECDFGFDNFVNDYEEDINMTEEEFDKETENMSYIESMIHYAKLYISKLKESDKNESN